MLFNHLFNSVFSPFACEATPLREGHPERQDHFQCICILFPKRDVGINRSGGADSTGGGVMPGSTLDLSRLKQP